MPSTIPALPAGSCVKSLYTLTSVSPIRIDYVSPLETNLITRLGLTDDLSTFSLEYVDTLIGDGPLAQQNKWYIVNYTLYLTDGTKIDSSVDRKQPFSFLYGSRQVITGWDTGFDGMRIGGKRRLYIPYQLAYGTKGQPPKIPAKAMFVTDVELLSQSDQNPNPPATPATKN